MTIHITNFHPSKNLDETQTYDASTKCPLCGDRRERKPVAEIQRFPLIYLLACDGCGGLSASRMPKAEVLVEYYAEYYSDRDNHHVTFQNPKRFARHILKFIPPRFFENRHSVSICDFGGGDCALSIAIAHLLKPRQINITLVDYDEGPSTIPEGVTIEKTRDLADVDNPHDVFLASAVLEHIPEAEPILKNIFSLLKPGGYFYARTPYILPIMKVIKKIDFSYPGHVHDMGPEFWNRLTETFSLEAEILVSQPSIVETEFSKAPCRTLVSYLMKFPAFVELAFNKTKKNLLWGYVGGWEVVLRRKTPYSLGKKSFKLNGKDTSTHEQNENSI